MENINIPILWKFERTEEYISKCYHSCFTQRGKKKPLFYLQPIYDVFVFDRICRRYDIAKGKGLFDKNVNFEAAIKEYRNGFKKGYKEFTDKVRNDLRYNEGTIFKTATQFFSSVSWYPYTYKEGKIIPKNWDILGENIGRFYAAWCIVLEYQDNFEPMFEKLYKPSAKVECILPPKLLTNEAKDIFNRGVEMGLFEKTTTGYKGKCTKQLIAYFAQEMSLKFKLSNKLDKDGNQTINWKVFEDLFEVKNLRWSKNDWLKTNTKFTPNNFKKVDQIINPT